jgi:hypothetical protein
MNKSSNFSELSFTNKYYGVPFIEHCERVESNNYEYNIVKLINLQTGSGKTHGTFNSAIPILFNIYGVKLICYTYPYSEIYDEDSVFDSTLLSDNVIHLKIEHTNLKTLLDDIYKSINKGKKILLTSTNASFFAHQENYGSELLKFCKEHNISSSLFLDEIHQWSTSDIENYRYNTGNNTPEFSATMYKSLSKWAKFTPYIFGLTATLTPEQYTNKVKGDTKYEVLVPPMPIEALIYTSGWLNNFTYYDIHNPLNSFFGFVDEFENSNRSLINWSEYAHKKNKWFETSMIIRVDSVKGEYHKNRVKNELINHLRLKFRGGYAKMEEYSIAIMDQKGCYIYNLNGGKLKQSETDIKDKLNSKSDPLRYLIVVERGKSGINISTMKWYFDFRSSSKRNAEDFIIQNLLQLCGRLQRLNVVGWDNSKFIKEYGYNLEKYISNLIENESFDELSRLLISNSYRVCVPNIPIWYVVEKKIVNEVSNTVDTVKEILSKTSDDRIIQESIVQSKINMTKSLQFLDNVNSDDIEWSDSYNLTDNIRGISNTIGVYAFIYKPTNEIVYIGYSKNISNRKAKHLTSFRVGGASVNEKSYFKSILGVKMFEFDPNIENYSFKYMSVGDEILAKVIEDKLISNYKPKFNATYMGGL